MKGNGCKLLLVTAAMLLSSCGGGGQASSENEVVTSLEGQSALSSSSISEAPTVSSLPTSSSSTDDTPTPVTGDRTLRIAYHNDDNSQMNLALYVWCDGLNGTLYQWDGALDDNFAYKDLKLDEAPYSGFADSSVWIIIRPKDTWTGQSADTEIVLSEFEFTATEDGAFCTVYCCEGPGGTVEPYGDMKEALGNKFSTFEIKPDLSGFKYTATAKPVFLNFYVFDSSFYAYPDDVRNSHRHDYLKMTLLAPSPNGEISLADVGETSFDPHKSYVITGAFSDNIAKVRTKYLDMKPIFDTSSFVSNYTYSGHDLGCTYDGSDKSTTFKVWAPTSARAEAIVYMCPTPRSINKGDTYHFSNDQIVAKIPLADLGQGVYGARYAEKDLEGYGYVYRLYRDGGYVDAVDPYAHASGANGRRGAIIDFSKTDPEGFEDSLSSLPTLNAPNELSVYEIHIRDLTSNATWNGEEKPGTYKAFIEKGTTYQGVTTGYDHIKEFGPDAIQILPVFDQDNDERSYDRTIAGEKKHFEPAYNWGYNPALYNVPEGSYASDPYRPEVRVKEYKDLIKTFADDGIRVIMDVVYNHVSSVTTNPFNSTVPGYYFQYDSKGFLIDHTGCGNTTASNRVMMANFMADSVCWWAKEYGVKGFRFDLMGALDYAAMRQLKDALYEIDPEIVVYGEPWSTSGMQLDEVYTRLNDNGKGSVGAFNNGGRDGLKGDTSYANITPSYGFMNTGIDHMNATMKQEAAGNFLGWNCSRNNWMDRNPTNPLCSNPAQTVNYVSCHDNYTLFDQLNYTLRGDTLAADTLNDATADFAKSGAVATLAATLLSQGMGFIQGGDEFFRHKIMYKNTEDPEIFEQMVESYKPDASYTDPVSGSTSYWVEGDGMEMRSGNWLVRNSYKYGDAVNGFDYSLKAENQARYLKVKEALTLRKSLMGSLFGKSKAQIDSGKATMWGDIIDGVNSTDPITAAYYRDDSNNRNYYIALSGREGTTEYDGTPLNNIGVGSCNVKIAYSSNDYHTVGQVCECTSTLGARDFELMLCYVVE